MKIGWRSSSTSRSRPRCSVRTSKFRARGEITDADDDWCGHITDGDGGDGFDGAGARGGAGDFRYGYGERHRRRAGAGDAARDGEPRRGKDCGGDGDEGKYVGGAVLRFGGRVLWKAGNSDRDGARRSDA